MSSTVASIASAKGICLFPKFLKRLHLPHNTKEGLQLLRLPPHFLFLEPFKITAKLI
ncbi:hypothetical protein V6Z11_A13G131300 [Gossypium hirsutum]